jgi:hypothetical protein
MRVSFHASLRYGLGLDVRQVSLLQHALGRGGVLTGKMPAFLNVDPVFIV